MNNNLSMGKVKVLEGVRRNLVLYAHVNVALQDVHTL